MVTFQAGDAEITLTDDAKKMLTSQGYVRADELQQGDVVCVRGGCGMVEITSPPVVS